jgi:hypothetical protein
MREHGAQAAPAELLRELGKITMLSGGKPATSALAPVSYSGTWWWVASVCMLSIVFAILCMLTLGKLERPKPAPAVEEYQQQRDDVKVYGDARRDKLRKAGLAE